MLFSSPNYKQSDVVMLVSRYSADDLNELEQVVQQLIKDHKKVVIVKNIFEFDFFNNKNIADNLLQKRYLEKYLNGNISVSTVVEDIDKNYYANFITRGRLSLLKKSDVAIEVIAKKYNEILILNRMDYVCDKKAKKCFSINDEFEKYFYDYGHHTLEGALFFGKRVDEVKWLKRLEKK